MTVAASDGDGDGMLVFIESELFGLPRADCGRGRNTEHGTRRCGGVVNAEYRTAPTRSRNSGESAYGPGDAGRRLPKRVESLGACPP